jgi:phosphoserine phosphatase
MVKILLVRAASTDFDEQGRIKGTLDIPLSAVGQGQVSQIVEDLHATKIDHVFASPARSAQQTAEALANDHRLRVKLIDELQNLDHGLWHGKRIDEVRTSQPRVFRQLQDHPETVCPPQGEPVGAAMERVRDILVRLVRKYKTGTMAIVVPEPLASLVRSTLNCCQVGDLWKSECECGSWELIEVAPEKVALAG